MQIDDTLLAKLEQLSMLRIPESKRGETKKNLEEILGFIENLTSIEVDETYPQEQYQTPLRADEVVDSGIALDVLSHAPKAQDNFFIVPKIIE